MAAIERLWYKANPLSTLLRPLAGCLGAIAQRRRQNYLNAVANTQIWRPPVPVIVVGNISVGGTGKTPVVIALAEYLRQQGYTPGVVSRGYGGKPGNLPLMVSSQTSVEQSGDEALLIYLRTGLPVAIDPDRPRAAKHLLANSDCDIIISDDGLQHYALFRDIELAVVDGQRGLGNGFCMPAGPLREKPARLESVDAVLVNGGGQHFPRTKQYDYELQVRDIVQLAQGKCLPLKEFPRGDTVHGVAGIGNPARFFATLRDLGFEIIEHAFSDHFRYKAKDLEFDDNRDILMTEKDAVKCRGFANTRHWYITVDAHLPGPFLDLLSTKLQSLK